VCSEVILDVHMARARTKQELLDFGANEYLALIETIDSLKSKKQKSMVVFGNRTVKDVIAHLYDWQQMVFRWIDEDKQDVISKIPGEGYSWKDIPALNEKLYQLSKDKSFDAIYSDFKTSHKKSMKLIESYTSQQLEAKKLFKWTGSTNLASYFASITSSHYVWANDLIKKAARLLL